MVNSLQFVVSLFCIKTESCRNKCVTLNLWLFQRLQHENIVQIKGVIQEPEVSLVMEFVPHGSLQCYLKINSDRLKPENLLRFAFDVAKVNYNFSEVYRILLY